MPGLMDTVLNLGMNDKVVEAFARKAGERFAWDSYRRFLGMFGSSVVGLDCSEFEQQLQAVKVHQPSFGGLPPSLPSLPLNALQRVLYRRFSVSKSSLGMSFVAGEIRRASGPAPVCGAVERNRDQIQGDIQLAWPRVP